MRSIFDQYTQPENKLTHALACVLEHDRSVLRPFLLWLGVRDIPPAQRLHIVEQQVPGELVSGDDEGDPNERKGLPDMCIFDHEKGWAVLIESKVQSAVRADQIDRHRRTAARHGFPETQVVILSVDADNHSLNEKAIWRQWREVFRWFDDQRDSAWSGHLVKYMQVLETKMIAKNYQVRGTMTTFNGLRFDDDNPFHYNEAKRLLRLLRESLQSHPKASALKLHPSASGRGGITRDEQGRVWDFIPPRNVTDPTKFTTFPHFDISLQPESATACITIPNGMRRSWAKSLRDGGYEQFRKTLVEIERNLRPLVRRSMGAKPRVRILQRHFLSQRSRGITDARLDFDLRTLAQHTSDNVKAAPVWAISAFEALQTPNANVQFDVRCDFSYECPEVRSSAAIDLFADAWVAMAPILELIDEAQNRKPRKRATA